MDLELDTKPHLQRVEALRALMLRRRGSLDEVGARLAGLQSFMRERGLAPGGPPFALYFDEEFNPHNADFAVCMPVAGAPVAAGDVLSVDLGATMTVACLYAGPYDGIGAAYQAALAFARKHGYQLTGPPRELYHLGPDKAHTPGELRTEIQLPVERVR